MAKSVARKSTGETIKTWRLKQTENKQAFREKVENQYTAHTGSVNGKWETSKRLFLRQQKRCVGKLEAGEVRRRRRGVEVLRFKLKSKPRKVPARSGKLSGMNSRNKRNRKRMHTKLPERR